MLWHRLALALGDTVAGLQARMPYREFLDWAALWSIEPWGDVRGDMQAALQAATLANVHRNRKQRKKAFTAQDFMPDFWQHKKVMSKEALRAKAMAIFAGLTGQDNGGE